MQIWKLLGALALVLPSLIFSPYLLAWLHLIEPLKSYAWQIMAIVVVGITFKILLGDFATGGFFYHKHGYDMCVMTFGAILSNLSLQILADHDLFPAISKTGPLTPFLAGTDDASKMRNLLYMMFILTLVLTTLTARISRAVSDAGQRGKPLLSALNFGIGSGLLRVYVLMLISKG